MTVAPPALVQLTEAFAKRPDRPESYVMGGIVGDAAHMNPPEGYHVSYSNLGGNCSKYGLAFEGDCAAGKAHPDWASAWDLSMDNADMITVTNRLITAAKAKDPRVSMLWEIAGTTNGTNVHAYYLNSNTDDPTNRQQWASSHLHHVHLSFKRSAVTSLATLMPLLDVICGVPAETEFTVSQIDDIAEAVYVKMRTLFGVDTNKDGKPDFTGTVQRAVTEALKPVIATQAAQQAEIDAIKKKLQA